MEKIKQNENKVLMKNNNLISKAKYNITTIENRIFQSVLYKLQKKNDDIYECTISHEEFKEFIKNNNQSTTESITKTLINLRKQSIFIQKMNEEGNVLWGEFGFINGFMFDSEKKAFKIKASEEVCSMLHNYLDTGYTPINLLIYLKIKNSYAQRFYELLRLWSGNKTVINYKISELKELLMIEEKYSAYADLKRRVIQVAVNELNSIGAFKIEFKENKVGRKVESIDFIVRDLDKRKYFVNKSNPGLIESSSIDNEPLDNNKYSIQSGISSFYIPDENIFTKGTLRSFKLDFREIDFINQYMKKAFNDAVMITLDRDDVETIKATSYKFFKGTLDNKIIEYRKEEEEDRKHKEEMNRLW